MRGDAEYRITGTRGTTATMHLQSLRGQPGIRDGGTSDHVDVLSADEMTFGPDGSFEVHVAATESGHGGNFLRIARRPGTILVRFSHTDWEKERAGRVQIERVGAEGGAQPPLTSARMAAGLREAAVSLFDRNATWLSYARRAWDLMPRNGVSSVRPAQGGLVGQFNAFGAFELEPDEALVITTRDPGVPNWLDTEGHRRGLIMLRWQGLDAAPPDEERPTAALVQFDAARKSFPADTPRFGPDERREQRRLRRRHVHQRFGG